MPTGVQNTFCFCGWKLGKEYTGKGLDRIGPTNPVREEELWAHSAMPRGCLIPVLQGGHRCWYPGSKLTSPAELKEGAAYDGTAYNLL